MSLTHRKELAWLTLAILISSFSATTGQNPHAPQCTPTYIRVNVTEPQGPGYVVTTLKCTDPDGGTVTYKMEGDNANNQFKIAADQIQANKDIDAEAKLAYDPTSYATPWTLRISATGSGGNTSFLSVYIAVLSVNEFPATMNNLKTTLTLPEDQAVGSIVDTCTLEDLDLPGSGHATPRVEITGGNADNKFAIDPVTCAMTLIGPLDYETNTSYSLTLTAYDNGSPSMNTTATVSVTVQDVNDHAPTCTFYNKIMEVNESRVAGETLLTLSCQDLDTGLGATLIYDRLVSSTTSYLNVDSSGNIKLTQDLDYDNGLRSLEIIVGVYDGTGPTAKSTTVTAAFTVTDVDDQPPVFNQSLFTASVKENEDIGYSVLTLVATDGDSPGTFLSQITYGWETPCTQDWFKLDSRTGSIFVQSLLDWEIAPKVQCQVFAYSSDKYDNRSLANVTITIIDINDRAPNFTQVLFEADLLEEPSIGSSVLTLSANDPDNGTGGIFTYFQPSASPFDIDPLTGKVSVGRRVNYEKDTNFLLLVEARDQGTPSLTSSTYVSINVLPVNEFTPSVSDATTSVSEDKPPGSKVITMAATDGDAGDDGKVEYYLRNSGQLPFVLERETGNLLVGVGLDADTKATYDLVVEVRDKSKTLVKTSTATVHVTVVNANDNSPECDQLGPIKVTPTTFNIGDILGTLSCRDGDGDRLRYIENSGDPHNIFTTDTDKGIIRLGTTPVEGTYIYTIIVTDQLNSIAVPVEISVETDLQWVNDPIFATILENTTVSSLVYKYEATGSYDTIKYEISGSDKFNMNPMTGELRVVGELDREQEAFYFLDITASTSSGQSIMTDLTIAVGDVNDNTPKYSSSFTEVKVSEDTTVPITIATISATDLDTLNNAQLTYSIISGNVGSTFQYDSSGNLKVVSALDYETVQSYTLVLGVKDNGSPQLSSTTIVFVVVTNVDDNNPIIVDSGGKIPLTLAENTAVGAKVIHINANDLEKGSDLSYNITGGNLDGVFSIDEKTGDVYLVLPLDREKVPAMSLNIQVTNAQGKTDTSQLEITISDVNDNDPVFSLGNYVFKNIPHNTQTGVDIGAVTVTDPDLGANQTLTLSILSGDPNGRFTFSGKTLKSAALLDANVQARYELVIQAKDGGNPSRSSTAYVTVLIDPEFKQPLFFPSSDSITVEETKIPGTLNYDSDATFAGATEHATGDLTYSIVSGNSEGSFYIETLSGTLQLIKRLSYAVTSSYILVIQAANRKNASLTDTFTLTITVTQVNKYEPFFSQDVYTYDVNENAAVGSVVGRVTATDQDIQEFGRVTYTIESNPSFKINATTGVITVSSALEYSRARTYNFYVKGTDNAGTASKTGTAVIAITIIDFNNHTPTFPKSPYVVTVPETTPVGEAFFVLAAVDLDSGDLGTVQYSIVSGNANRLFAINTAKGELKVISGLDFETSQQYIIVVRGFDGGKPSRSGTATVTINILDENDNTPQFSPSWDEIAVSGDTAPLTSIYKATATDGDAGMNGDVNYIIQSGNDDRFFSIDTVSGDIKTTRSLAKASDSYTLIVIGVDQGLPTLTGTMTIRITVTPISSTPYGDYYFTVSENEARGTLVGLIPKDPSRTILGYTITGGNFGDAFVISMNANRDGVLTTSIVLDRESYAFYQLHISIQHSSGVDTIDVSVTVSDDNDNAPVFDKTTLTIQMVENLAAGNVIGALTVSDPDAAGVNSEVHLSLSHNSPLGLVYFSVAQSGVISVAQPVSYEVFRSLTFEVIATDRGTPQQTSTATVVVIVVDVVETIVVTPIVSAFYTSTEMPDDVINGETVFTVTPAHVNQTPQSGATVRYTTVDSTDSIFVIHASTGVLSVNKERSIYSNARYFQWVIVSVTSGGNTTSYALNIRIDTFSRRLHMIVITVGVDGANLKANRASFLGGLQTLHKAPRRVSIWKIQDVGGTGRRRLLATESEALVVVVADDAADDLANIDQPKTFLTQDEAAQTLQANPPDSKPKPALTGGSTPVTSVETYEDDDDDDSLSTELIVLIVVAVLAGIAILIGIIAVIIYCTVYRRSPKDDKKQLVDKDKRSNNFGRLENSAPPRDTAARTSREPVRASLSYGPAKESTVRGGGGPVNPGNMAANFLVPAAVPVQTSRKPSPTRGKNNNSVGPRKNVKQPAEQPKRPSNQPEVRSDPHLNTSNVAPDPDADGMPNRPVTATYVSSSMTSLKPSETITQKNSSTMLASLEEEEAEA